MNIINRLGREAINSVDMFRCYSYIHPDYLEIFTAAPGKEHYRLLAYLSTLMDYKVILDIGTCEGYSAVALAHNRKNKIITYDLSARNRNKLIDLPNIEFRTGNVLGNEIVFQQSSLIFLDTTPHDSGFEQQVYDYLIESKWQGALLLDDTHLNDEMKVFWGQIKNVKYDITDFGHFTGTGLVIF